MGYWSSESRSLEDEVGHVTVLVVKLLSFSLLLLLCVILSISVSFSSFYFLYFSFPIHRWFKAFPS